MIYLDIESIKGNCLAEDYAEQIIVDSFSIGAANAITSDPANSERTLDRVQFSEMSFSKEMDSSSMLLYAACAGNQKLGDVTVSVTRTEGEAQMLLVTFVLEDAMISSISTSGSSGGGLPGESFTINFTAITGQYTKQNSDASADGQAVMGWDMKTRKVKAPA